MADSPAKKQMDADVDSLDIYMHKLNELGEFSAAQQAQLCRDFECIADELRAQVSCAGFVIPEIICRCRNILVGSEDAADVFMVSSLQKMGANRSEQLDALEAWCSELEEKYQLLFRKFSAGEDTDAERRELYGSFCRYRLSLQVISQLLDYGCGYLRMIAPGFSPENGSLKAIPADLAPELAAFMKEKFLMPLAELPEYSSLVIRLVNRLHEQRNKLVECNLKLVVSIAQRYRNRGVAFNDLIQEGNLGLMRALEKIDFSLGYKFSTYASWWIRHRIVRAVTGSSRVIRLPMHMIKLLSDISHAEQRFIQLYGCEPESSDIAQMLELPVARVSAVRKMAVQTVSLQTQIGNDEDSSELGDLLSDENAESPSAEVSRKLLYERLYAMLRTLPEREQQILMMRFGLHGHPVLTLSEIGAKLKLTRERCRQIELRLLAKLRSPEKLKFIDGINTLDGLK